MREENDRVQFEMVVVYAGRQFESRGMQRWDTTQCFGEASAKMIWVVLLMEREKRWWWFIFKNGLSIKLRSYPVLCCPFEIIMKYGF